jgi:hypothetical protein
MYIDRQMGRKRTTGSRFRLGSPYDEMLDDFCAAMLDASATEVMRRAVTQFVLREVADNPGIKIRYDAARQMRATGIPANVAPIRPSPANAQSKNEGKKK